MSKAEANRFLQMVQRGEKAASHSSLGPTASDTQQSVAPLNNRRYPATAQIGAMGPTIAKIFVGVSTPSCADEKKPMRDPARTHPRTVNECLSSDPSNATPLGVPPAGRGFSPWRINITSVGPVMRAGLVPDDALISE